MTVGPNAIFALAFAGFMSANAHSASFAPVTAIKSS
jgi:hypothetical protein